MRECDLMVDDPSFGVYSLLYDIEPMLIELQYGIIYALEFGLV